MSPYRVRSFTIILLICASFFCATQALASRQIRGRRKPLRIGST